MQLRDTGDLFQVQKRPTYYSDLLQCLLLQCQKRPTTVSKETYYSVKRDLLQCVYACDALAHVCMRNLSLSLTHTHTHTPSRV